MRPGSVFIVLVGQYFRETIDSGETSGGECWMGANMPSRWLSSLIVLFWLATTGWLFWHDLWPKWRPGEPPPLQIDDVEEVQHKDDTPMHVFWNVERQEGQDKPYPVFSAQTWVAHQGEDVYTFNAKLDATKDPQYRPFYVGKIFKIDKIASAYRVNRDGQLRALEATVTVRPDWEKFSFLGHRFRSPPATAQKNPAAESIELSIWGEVHDRQFFAHCRAKWQLVEQPMQFDLPAVDVSYTGSVLMPLHPVSHIRGLRLGQRWHQPLVDPLRDAFAALPGFSGGVRWLNARVLPQPEMLKRDKSEIRCLVIEYTNDENEPMGRTWVEQDGERVQQQEAVLDDGRWIMKRDDERRSGKRLSRVRRADEGAYD